MKDVAAMAGVSLATVSRSFSAPETVSLPTRLRIESAIKRLDYTVNASARNLRRQSSGLVVVLLPDIGNPFFSVLLQGIEETARSAGRVILVGDTEKERERARRYSREIEAHRPDGVILLNGYLPFSGSQLSRLSFPIVAVSERIPGATVPTVGIDNVHAAQDATAFLAALGHRAIAHIAGPKGNILTQERLAGFRRGLAEAGLGGSPELIGSGDFSIASGRRAAAQLLGARRRPTAIFASNDEMAVGAVIEAKRRGLRVPADLSVVGFDDIEFAEAYDPSITTIRQPRREMGREAMRLLIDLIEGRRPDDTELVLPHELIERKSSGPAPEGPDHRSGPTLLPTVET
jgi:LacI family repressor for deo operon, udp, cdd, tsx, nupC, and nupG